MSYASDALIDALTHENNQLKDENTKLKEDREHLFQMCLEKNGEILNLLIEAARRRELAHLNDARAGAVRCRLCR